METEDSLVEKKETNEVHDTNAKKIRIVKIVSIIAIVLIISLFVILPIIKDVVAKKVIQTKTENLMANIQSGLSEQEYQKIEDNLFDSLTSNDAVPAFVAEAIAANVDSEDIDDIFVALMRHMKYQVKTVEKVGKNRYNEELVIENIDLSATMSYIIETKKKSYSDTGIFGKILQGLGELNSMMNGDFSENLAEMIIEAEDHIVEEYPEKVISRTYDILFFKEKGEWQVGMDDALIKELIKGCCGIPE